MVGGPSIESTLPTNTSPSIRQSAGRDLKTGERHAFTNLFYATGALNGLIASGLFVRLLVLWASQGHVPQVTALALGFFAMMSALFTMFAMLFDMEANRDLKG